MSGRRGINRELESGLVRVLLGSKKGKRIEGKIKRKERKWLAVMGLGLSLWASILGFKNEEKRKMKRK